MDCWGRSLFSSPLKGCQWTCNSHRVEVHHSEIAADAVWKSPSPKWRPKVSLKKKKRRDTRNMEALRRSLWFPFTNPTLPRPKAIPSDPDAAARAPAVTLAAASNGDGLKVRGPPNVQTMKWNQQKLNPETTNKQKQLQDMK